jgi:hypothetical protein
MVKKNSYKGLIFGGIIVLVVIIIAGIFLFSGGQEESGQYDEFAKCLMDSGVILYGSVTCPVCAQERELFGASFRFIDEIECSPFEDNSQAELCLEKGIEKTPTWILEENGVEVQRLEGYQKLETLSELSGCSL